MAIVRACTERLAESHPGRGDVLPQGVMPVSFHRVEETTELLGGPGLTLAALRPDAHRPRRRSSWCAAEVSACVPVRCVRPLPVTLAEIGGNLKLRLMAAVAV